MKRRSYIVCVILLLSEPFSSVAGCEISVDEPVTNLREGLVQCGSIGAYLLVFWGVEVGQCTGTAGQTKLCKPPIEKQR